MTPFNIVALFSGEVTIYLMLGVVGLLLLEKDNRVAKKTLFAMAIVWIIVFTVKRLFPSLRPFEILEIVPLTVVAENTSFPSAHAALAFTMATSVWLAKHPLGFIMLVMAVVVAVGRILLWVHFPVDVIVGALIGVLVVLVVNRLNLFGWGND